MTIGRTRIKTILDVSLVCCSDISNGDQVRQEDILGMYFMGIRLDLADGTMCVPDEVLFGLEGRGPPYRSTIQAIDSDDIMWSIVSADRPR